MSASSSRQVGPYLLGERLGEGGQGQVFRARHSDTNEAVALKLLELGDDPQRADELRRRVEREVAALRKVSHPGIVRVRDHGEHPETTQFNLGYLYITYDLIEGFSLHEWLHREIVRTPDDSVAWLERIGQGLQMAHDCDILHRDVKPANIMLGAGVCSEAVLVDFGYVMLIGRSKLTASGRAVGTEAYLSPEVVRDATATSRVSDQWSLARTFAEALLITFGTEPSVLLQARPRELVEQLRPRAPHTARALEQPLNKDPSARCPSIAAMIMQLAEAAAEDDLVNVQAAVWRPGTSLREYFESLGYETIDTRYPGGGNLWIVASKPELQEVAATLAKQGIKLVHSKGSGPSGGRHAWFTKALT